MILRPVNPVSPCGPPTTNRPVGLIRNWVCLSSMFAGNTFLMTSSMMNSRMVLCFAFGGVLRGNDHVGDAGRLVIYVLNGHLRFGVRPQPLHFAGLADVGQFAAEAMGEHDRRGHQFRGFVAGVTEHQSLVAGTLFGGGFLPSASRASTPWAMSGLCCVMAFMMSTLSA